MATVSNLGTSIARFFLFRNLIQAAVQKSKYDDGLMENLEDVYKALILSNLVSFFFFFLHFYDLTTSCWL